MEELRYDTGKNFIYVFGAGAVISFLLMIVAFTPFFVFTLIVTCFGSAMTVNRYRHIFLYEDRIEILIFFGNQLMGYIILTSNVSGFFTGMTHMVVDTGITTTILICPQRSWSSC